MFMPVPEYRGTTNTPYRVRIRRICENPTQKTFKDVDRLVYAQAIYAGLVP